MMKKTDMDDTIFIDPDSADAAVLRYMRDRAGIVTPKEANEAISSYSGGAVRGSMSKLAKSGVLEKLGLGRYRLSLTVIDSGDKIKVVRDADSEGGAGSERSAGSESGADSASRAGGPARKNDGPAPNGEPTGAPPDTTEVRREGYVAPHIDNTYTDESYTRVREARAVPYGHQSEAEASPAHTPPAALTRTQRARAHSYLSYPMTLYLKSDDAPALPHVTRAPFEGWSAVQVALPDAFLEQILSQPPPDTTRAIQMDSDAWAPEIRPGDLVFFAPVRRISDTGRYIILLDGHVQFRRIQRRPGGILRLMTDSADYEPDEIREVGPKGSRRHVLYGHSSPQARRIEVTFEVVGSYLGTLGRDDPWQARALVRQVIGSMQEPRLTSTS